MQTKADITLCQYQLASHRVARSQTRWPEGMSGRSTGSDNCLLLIIGLSEEANCCSFRIADERSYPWH
jgi:hypothetical protein